MKVIMYNFLKASRIIVVSQILAACFFILQCLPTIVAAADNDQEILNQLYQDIINSSPAGKSIKLDTMHTPSKTISRDQEIVPASDKNSGLVSERLKKEMEKIMRDAQLRHSDAVKFMQDAK
jgi:hypothetical protein